MLPEAGATELIFIAAVALIVVGPKDLPALLRKVGQFTAKMRGLAAEFRASFDELARQSELDELRKEVDALRNAKFMEPVTREVESHFNDLHKEFAAPPPPLLTDEGVILPGPNAPIAEPDEVWSAEAIQADQAAGVAAATASPLTGAPPEAATGVTEPAAAHAAQEVREAQG